MKSGKKIRLRRQDFHLLSLMIGLKYEVLWKHFAFTLKTWVWVTSGDIYSQSKHLGVHVDGDKGATQCTCPEGLSLGRNRTRWWAVTTPVGIRGKKEETVKAGMLEVVGWRPNPDWIDRRCHREAGIQMSHEGQGSAEGIPAWSNSKSKAWRWKGQLCSGRSAKQAWKTRCLTWHLQGTWLREQVWWATERRPHWGVCTII